MSARKRSALISTAVRAALVASGVAAVPAHALEYNWGEWLFNVDTTLSAGAQWRTESIDKDMAFDEGGLNFNDGNNNFGPGLVSNNMKALLEFSGEYKDFSFFLRGDALYDWVYNENKRDLSDAAYASYNNGIPAGGNLLPGELPRDTIVENGRRTRLLDAFATYNFDVGDQSGAVRFGRQVIAWGGSRFYSGVNALQNPIDAVAAQTPGVEVKEIFLPTSAINLKWDFTGTISAEAYYKLNWERSTLPGVGSFLSTSDTTGAGAERVLLGPLGAAPIVSRLTPEDDDQWGFAARYSSYSGYTFELAYTTSHSNIPGAQIKLDLGGGDSFFREVYTEDIDVWAASFSGNLSEAEVYIDLAYSDNMPFVDVSSQFTDDGYFTRSDVTRGHYWQASVGFSDVYTALPWLSPSIAVLAEAHVQGNNLGESDLIPPPAGITPPGERNLKVTDSAWGYQAVVTLRYFSVIQGMDMNVIGTFRHDVEGYGNAIGLNNGLKEDLMTASIGATAYYLTNWQFDAKYAWYFGNDDAADQTLDDRDNISIGVKYRF
ncbi:DUF1302 domain-containing protein [Pseudohalioglobus lutimaris]|uniref:DUF1302 domain-containing protein n=1 Tax=Pseudohalioglobus lutimaris TaxID=1737061 RepID=A0A2N5X6H6_9GAMM|nr:DUF1302 family protein [Pseudohalioglobus lutimaris]PLW70091.1 hypothetical protein C0039_02425 [Pseudohalioglobus lutimaris]